MSSDNSIGKPPDLSQLPWPPGFAGELARAIELGSYTPVREVAITAALGLLAGVCGRGYRTHTGKDLALYVILVAHSGIGKDAIHEGIPGLIRLGNVAGAEYFVRAENFKSGPALHKALLMNPGFLNLQGEFGRKLKGMANPNNAPMQDLRTVMTNAYGKQFLEGVSYSKAEDSLAGVDWPALSFLGETTPGAFLESLTADMMEDGFLSRFLVISYDGERPLPNHERFLFLDDSELKRLRDLLWQMLPYQGRLNNPLPRIVGFKNDDAFEKLVKFELRCRDEINATKDEFERAVWNRAHLKALKVACLLAVADRGWDPRIDLGHATWAMTTVQRDVELFQQRKWAGDVGNDDASRERKLLTMIYDVIMHGAPASYKVPAGMSQAGIFTRKYLQQKTSDVTQFRSYRYGATAALDATLRSLVDSGYIREVPKQQAEQQFSFGGKCYQIALSLDQFKLSVKR